MAPKLFDLPEELFEMILERIPSPEDYFHLSITCKALWDKLGSPEQLYRLDATAFRWRANRSTGLHNLEEFIPGWRYYLQEHPNGKILSWLIRNHRPVDVVRQAIAVYFEVYPSIIYSNQLKDIRPLDCLICECNYVEYLQALLDIGILEPIQQEGPVVMHSAVWISPSADPILWLTAHDVRILQAHVDILVDRGIVEVGDAQWQLLQAEVERTAGLAG
ncbi:hypothetical protein F5Y04DRAFT_293410 [Hypomontagnella monticulosa]|nr:hypothetical protein F5Y04DRAFT_293410 [Hypomontagnella monticulosa]